MDKKQVLDILERSAFPGSDKGAKLVETHISWVILTPDFAFKIKKPIQYDFLDYSTLLARKKFCQDEYRLNRRFAPDTYLGVLPIGLKNVQLRIAKGIENPIDYAVWMRREDNSRQLDVLLNAGKVKPDDLKLLAHSIAVFHRAHELPHPHFDPDELVVDFADLFHHEKLLLTVLGRETRATLEKMKAYLPIFIEKHSRRLKERAASGQWVDGHGDLHCRNIFLTDPPIVFDCIEFNPHLRHLDVLNELAFLCMDFDHHARPDLSVAFLQYYQLERPCIEQPEDELLFQFFKAYRANVRLKVALLSGAKQEEVMDYWALMIGYWRLVAGC
jgi:aminoglycoside phosphotransferase family enzyme